MRDINEFDRRLQALTRQLMHARNEIKLLRAQFAATYAARLAEVDRIDALFMSLEVDIIQLSEDCENWDQNDRTGTEYSN